MEAKFKRGEWDNEPDGKKWESNGLKCEIKRNPHLGHLCGYVGVPKGHLLYGKDYDNKETYSISVHGGLTYSQIGEDAYLQAGYWWFGFDCAHCDDLSPFMHFTGFSHSTYKNFAYVIAETEKLAEQLGSIPIKEEQK